MRAWNLCSSYCTDVLRTLVLQFRRGGGSFVVPAVAIGYSGMAFGLWCCCFPSLFSRGPVTLARSGFKPRNVSGVVAAGLRFVVVYCNTRHHGQ